MAALPVDRERGTGRHLKTADEASLEPSLLLVEFADAIADAPLGRALDIACGNGRNAFFLASLGYRVTAADRSAAAVAFVERRAQELGVDVEAVETDTAELDPGLERFAVIANIDYLDRNLVPRLIRGLRPGGYLFFESHTTDECDVLGHDARREQLLERNEALRLFAPLHILYYREAIVPGDDDDSRPRAMARLIGKAPPVPLAVPGGGGTLGIELPPGGTGEG
ncbi:MAG: methyltransferase domain-containing protein [Candidatus Eiseniibacteriota bacterium]|jgi:SAM-dependent methyltransferase